MKKEHYRDYATAAYRMRARLGSSLEYAAKIWDEAMMQNPGREGPAGGLGNPTEAAVIAAERSLEEKRAVLEDLAAADRAMQIIENKSQGAGMLDALRIVYMSEPDRPMKRSEIAARAQAAAEECHVDIATIYRWLWMARRLFAQERGLRVKDASSAGV